MFSIFASAPEQVGAEYLFMILSFGLVIGTVVNGVIDHLNKRWHNERYLELWNACVDRRKRLNEGLNKLRKSKLAELSELPRSADKLLGDIYASLRRADMVYHEVLKSESAHRTPTFGSQGQYISDQQAQELFKVADRNIAEYSQHYKAVMAGVERSVGQAIVYATTLDTLRVRMLGYRLTGSSAEANTMEFLTVVTEAKMQFAAIDKALEEIELTPFPEVVTIPSETKVMRDNLASNPSSPPPVTPDHLKPQVRDDE